MSTLRQQGSRLRLDRQAYDELRKQVLERDGWRCQNCGSSENLQVHHIQSRGRLGADTLANLITLCACCHRDVHLKFHRTTSNKNTSDSGRQSG
ncbi:MAG: HNH endonuclease [Candidatus Acidiferrales bacterium]